MQQKELYGEITAFMGRLREDPSRENITNMQGAIDYLLEKLHIVTEKLQEATGRKEIVLDDKDRRRLASKARVLNSHLLEMVEDTWMPDTLMDWYRRLIADKYDSSGSGGKRIGRPRTPPISFQSAATSQRSRARRFPFQAQLISFCLPPYLRF